MRYMQITDYNSGKTFYRKLNKLAANASIEYYVENFGKYAGRLVIRDYYSGVVLQTISVKMYGSIQFKAIENI